MGRCKEETGHLWLHLFTSISKIVPDLIYLWDEVPLSHLLLTSGVHLDTSQTLPGKYSASLGEVKKQEGLKEARSSLAMTQQLNVRKSPSTLPINSTKVISGDNVVVGYI